MTAICATHSNSKPAYLALLLYRGSASNPTPCRSPPQVVTYVQSGHSKTWWALASSTAVRVLHSQLIKLSIGNTRYSRHNIHLTVHDKQNSKQNKPGLAYEKGYRGRSSPPRLSHHKTKTTPVPLEIKTLTRKNQLRTKRRTTIEASTSTSKETSTSIPD